MNRILQEANSSKPSKAESPERYPPLMLRGNPQSATSSPRGFTPNQRSGLFQFACLLLGFELLAAPSTNSPAVTSALTKGETTAPAVLPPPPQSVFVLPKKASEGKDPFFPNSTRVYISDTEVKPKGPVVVVGDLALKGISGTAAEPLAIINTTTFTTGEENDVITSAGRMRVRCVEINMALGTVVVQVGGQRRELRLDTKR